MIAPNREERLSLLGAAYTQAFIDNDLAKLVGDKVRVVGRLSSRFHGACLTRLASVADFSLTIITPCLVWSSTEELAFWSIYSFAWILGVRQTGYGNRVARS
jgi:hypothetical protein